MQHDARTLQHWILTEGRTASSVNELLERLAAQLPGDVPLHRIWAGTKLLHPQAAAYLWIWEEGDEPVQRELSYDLLARLSTQDSPIRRIELGAAEVHLRLRAGEGLDLPDVADLWSRGFTEQLALPLDIRGKFAGGVTWATRAPEGFSPAQLELFRAVQPALVGVLESLARELMTATLLRTYLGRDAGERVVQGQVQRGDGQTLRAVVWFSDVRGFTRLSADLGRDGIIDLLNDTFEVLVDTIEEAGGEVLKFMGDGLLGVFPAAEDDPTGAEACAAARGAAAGLAQRLAELGGRRRARGLLTAEVGTGLHYGDVSYGNIGSPGRLDFTVIGPAVNLAARIEGLTGSLGRAVLASSEFAAREGGAWASVGHHPLKGVAEPVAIFEPSNEEATRQLEAVLHP